ncbi:MAG: DUF192 domain-containing protein [Sphingomonadales bacterium]
MLRKAFGAQAGAAWAVVKWVMVACFVAAANVPLLAKASGPQDELPLSKLTIVAKTGHHQFEVETAATPEQKRIGLMYRREMADDHGMLFEFKPPQLIGMWMKNTFISLDILFISADGRIVNIARDTTPHSLTVLRSAGPAKAALELGAGTAERLGIQPGDMVRHPLFTAVE